jgi:hypothetical protein
MQATVDETRTEYRRQQLLLATAVIFIVFAALLLWWNRRGPSARFEVEAERPLLKKDAGGEFHDTQVNVRLTPPPAWSLQGRTTAAPNVQVKERLLVKFKRMLPGQYPAWLRVYVEDGTYGSLTDAVQKRKPGLNWSKPSSVKPLTIAGQPAAKVSYTGTYNGVPSIRDIVGVQADDRTFWFIATYNTRDQAAPGETAAAIQSTLFTTR